MAAARGLILFAIMAAASLCACGSEVHEPTTDPCQFGSAVFDVGPVNFCRQAIALAEAKLGWVHWPITSTTFRQSMCPPNARCRGPGPDEGTVIFTFSVGEPRMIFVAHAQGTGGEPLGPIEAGDPQPVPDWVLEQIQSQGSGAGG
jgi:hypothetical protein